MIQCLLVESHECIYSGTAFALSKAVKHHQACSALALVRDPRPRPLKLLQSKKDNTIVLQIIYATARMVRFWPVSAKGASLFHFPVVDRIGVHTKGHGKINELLQPAVAAGELNRPNDFAG